VEKISDLNGIQSRMTLTTQAEQLVERREGGREKETNYLRWELVDDEAGSFSDAYILTVLTGIDGPSIFETAARTSGYGDSLGLVISRAWLSELKGDVLDFVISELQFGGRVVLRRAVVRLSVEIGGGVPGGRASSALALLTHWLRRGIRVNRSLSYPSR